MVGSMIVFIPNSLISFLYSFYTNSYGMTWGNRCAMPPGTKKERWGAKRSPPNLGPQGQLPIFEFESVFLSLGSYGTTWGGRWAMLLDPKKKDGAQKEHLPNLGQQDQLPIFEFKSVFLSLGRSRAFDLKKVFFQGVTISSHAPFATIFPPYDFVVILRHSLKVTLPSFRLERRYFSGCHHFNNMILPS
jgi:hypothetical protein